MNEDMSEMLKNFSKMMNNNQEIPDNIKNILNNMNNNNSSNSSVNQENNTEQNNNNNNNNNNNVFNNIDINTIMKIQQVLNSMNSKENDSRTNLLMSLKPYLKDSRKNKVDQYIQLMKMSKIIEVLNPLGGDNKNVQS